MNNVMSNWMFMDMADIRTQDLFAGITSYLSGDADYQEAALAGAFGADFVSNELRDNVLRPLLDEMRNQMRGGKGGLEGEFGKVGMILDVLAKGWKKFDGAMLTAYQVEDQVFRMALYIRRRNQGMSVDDAAIEARDQFLNYDIRAPWINMARRSFLPFIAYTYRAVPKIAETIANRPWKIAKYIAIAQAMNMLAYTVAPSDDYEEEERKSFRPDQSGSTWIKIPFTDIGAPRMMRMPWLSDSGDPVFLDIRRWVPAGDVFEVNGDLPSWLMVGGPIALGMELYLNKTAFTGQAIAKNPLTSTFPERAADRADYLWKSFMPNAPWVLNSWSLDQLWRAARGDALQWDSREPYNLGAAALNSLGVKLAPQDVETGYAVWQLRFDAQSREWDARERDLVRQYQRNIIDQEKLDLGIDYINEERNKLYDAKLERFPQP
jgi:hypothetical protein